MTNTPPPQLLSPDDARAAGEPLGIPERVAQANIMRFALRHPAVANVFAGMIDVAVFHGALDARLREIAILRVGWRIGSVYEWSNHVGVARGVGLTDDEIVAIRSADASVLTEADLVAIRVVDDVLEETRVSESTLAAARAVVGDGDALLELVTIPAFYRAIGTMLLTYGVPLEDGLAAWGPDGHGPDHDGHSVSSPS
jgi:alkylhydroperoxidase family enzyme